MALCWLLVHIFLLSSSSSSAHNDFFTSIGHMTELLSTEKELVSSLKDYITAEESKLQQVKRWADRLDLLSSVALQDPEGFLGHPVNAFKLMKRLNTEWKELESLVLSDMSDAFISNFTIQRQHFPNDDDQTGAAKALTRLLDTYQLDTNTMSTGALPGSSLSHRSALTADDCYDLGKVAYSEADYYHTELWMLQALRQLDEGETSGSVDAVTVLDYLSYSVYQQGALEPALGFTRRLLELDPTHQRAMGNLKYFEFQLDKQKGEEGGRRRETRGRPPDYLPERKKYEQLCRGEGLKMTPRRRSRLFCRYHDNDRHPKYVIGPVKQEDEWDRPRIVRYHDIVSDAEIEKVKELAKPRVANYGVGGQYEPHYDFGRKDEPDAFEELGTGNRIATWLLYMSDVQAGGATVFTDVGAAIWPKKGSAVFWYNLYPSGEGDYRTRHAACPVLVGNKWVSNKWIHERGQEFRRRCGLQETD
ncbi:prolyl 4-hydroxylase subunit alpha-1-like isoform X3 [Cebidichthys violaceus]|uniref:prolyl 4-hydroxylase subunit alpha-1-like isoform X3 n=1 Tax=Cebidichthys violaceus TaxID=271503 RepID=UPI0035CBAF07